MMSVRTSVACVPLGVTIQVS